MKKPHLAVLVLLLAAGCAGDNRMTSGDYGGGDSVVTPKRSDQSAPPMDPTRKISEQDCIRPVDSALGNLMCMDAEAAAAERRRQEEEERQRKLAAERRAKIEAEERARLERERAEQLAREEAARKAKAAEEARLAAELKARLERERLEREAAEARERQRAEQEAREAAERERRRLEEEWLAGRALLERFVANYGKVEKFKDVAEPITGFLDRTR